MPYIQGKQSALVILLIQISVSSKKYTGILKIVVTYPNTINLKHKNYCHKFFPVKLVIICTSLFFVFSPKEPITRV